MPEKLAWAAPVCTSAAAKQTGRSSSAGALGTQAPSLVTEQPVLHQTLPARTGCRARSTDWSLGLPSPKGRFRFMCLLKDVKAPSMSSIPSADTQHQTLLRLMWGNPNTSKIHCISINLLLRCFFWVLFSEKSS